MYTVVVSARQGVVSGLVPNEVVITTGSSVVVPAGVSVGVSAGVSVAAALPSGGRVWVIVKVTVVEVVVVDVSVVVDVDESSPTGSTVVLSGASMVLVMMFV